MNNLANPAPQILLFDVNETLLDLKPLEERIDEVLLQEGASKLWFSTMLQYSLAMTVSNQYAPLGVPSFFVQFTTVGGPRIYAGLREAFSE